MSKWIPVSKRLPKIKQKVRMNNTEKLNEALSEAEAMAWHNVRANIMEIARYLIVLESHVQESYKHKGDWDRCEFHSFARGVLQLAVMLMHDETDVDINNNNKLQAKPKQGRKRGNDMSTTGLDFFNVTPISEISDIEKMMDARITVEINNGQVTEFHVIPNKTVHERSTR